MFLCKQLAVGCCNVAVVAEPVTALVGIRALFQHVNLVVSCIFGRHEILAFVCFLGKSKTGTYPEEVPWSVFHAEIVSHPKALAPVIAVQLVVIHRVAHNDRSIGSAHGVFLIF